jgi:two-component SAPR family response regulator
MNKSIKILHFKSNVDSKIIETELLKRRLYCDVKSISNTEEYKEALETDVYDIILSDDGLPVEEIYSAMKFAREMTPQTAFVLLAAIKSEIKNINSNQPKDYKIPKTQLEILAPTINRLVKESVDKQDISCYWG